MLSSNHLILSLVHLPHSPAGSSVFSRRMVNTYRLVFVRFTIAEKSERAKFEPPTLGVASFYADRYLMFVAQNVVNIFQFKTKKITVTTLFCMFRSTTYSMQDAFGHALKG